MPMLERMIQKYIPAPLCERCLENLSERLRQAGLEGECLGLHIPLHGKQSTDYCMLEQTIQQFFPPHLRFAMLENWELRLREVRSRQRVVILQTKLDQGRC